MAYEREYLAFFACTILVQQVNTTNVKNKVDNIIKYPGVPNKLAITVSARNVLSKIR